MSRGIKRDGNGQFAPGHSGNPAGARLRQAKALLTIEDMHRITLEVASEVVTTIKGKPVTRFEAASRNLAAGKSDTRLASRDALDLFRRSAGFFAAEERAAATRRRGQ